MIGLGISGILGLIVGLIIGWSLWSRRKFSVLAAKTSTPDFNVKDILRLANTNNTAAVNALFLEYKMNVCMPEFYEKYQHLSKKNRDSYYAELLGMLERKKPDHLPGYCEWTSFSPQDQLLLLMYGMQLDNKTIARILGVSSDTLKKRRNRLKLKINVTDFDAEEKENG